VRWRLVQSMEVFLIEDEVEGVEVLIELLDAARGDDRHDGDRRAVAQPGEHDLVRCCASVAAGHPSTKKINYQP
jgi:hypothetical protein